MDPQFAQVRDAAQNFATRALEAYSTGCVVVLLQPWSHEMPPPAGLVCPSPDGMLNINELNSATQGKSVIVLAGTYLLPEEEAMAPRIVDQVRQRFGENICVAAAHLLLDGTALTPEVADRVARVQQFLQAMDIDDVIFSPSLELSNLRLTIKTSERRWNVNRQNFREFEKQQTEQLRDMEARHHKLLFEEIPHYLIPQFTRLNPDLEETENNSGDYDLVSKMETRCGEMWEALNSSGARVALKRIKKRDVLSPGIVEGIHREYRFLSELVRHPNVVRAVDFLHGPTCIHMIFDHAGEQNLDQYLSGNTMPVDVALDCFGQLASALESCHAKNITHRSVSLHHMVVRKNEDSGLLISLCDFHCATVSKPGVRSQVICGWLPYLSPEVLLDRPYLPIPADCWSAGVVLLEMAGGIGSMQKAANFSTEEMAMEDDGADAHLISAGHKLQGYLNRPSNHEDALACVGGTHNEEVLAILRGLLQTVSRRKAMRAFTLAADASPNASARISSAQDLPRVVMAAVPRSASK